MSTTVIVEEYRNIEWKTHLIPAKPKRLNARWAWLDKVELSAITEQHVHIAYGLNNQPCLLGKCRQNCKSNPLCLNGLGEAKWLEQSGNDVARKDDGTEEADVEAMKTAKERKDDVVGLVNYGNTCYLNSFLQLYYRMTDLRQAVYNTNEVSSRDDEESSQGGRSVIRELKLIFAQLQIGVHSPVEPAGLVNALGLQLQEPQDAPEFHSLFMTFLERHMASPASATVRSLLEGSFMYTNHCLSCGYNSNQQTTFLELTLELSDMSHLTQSIEQSLETESLTEDNQYSCPVCNGKRDGERRVRLTRLPPLLCFHLLRFTYDRKRGCKRKNKARIQIPSHLDMAPFIRENERSGNTWRYVLKGILIHLGPQPFSGHYVAVVHDYKHGWIVFNDEQTTRLKSLNLARIETEALRNRGGGGGTGRATAEGGKEGEKLHESRNAYMVLYEVESQFEKRAGRDKGYEVEVPNVLRDRVEAQNVVVREEWQEAVRSRSEARERSLIRHQCMRDLVQKLYCDRRAPPKLEKSLPTIDGVNDAFPATTPRRSVRQQEIKAEEEDEKKATAQTNGVEEVEFVPTDWLSRCLRLSSPQPLSTPVLEWSDRLLCCHGRLRPDTAPERVKLLPSRLVGQLLGPQAETSRRMPLGRALCLSCVRLHCALARFQMRAGDVGRKVEAWKKRGGRGGEMWIGRASLNRWRALGRRAVHEGFAAGLPDDDSGADSEEEEEEEEDELVFNTDLLCQHGNLTLDESKRRLLPEELWRGIVEAFPDSYPSIRSFPENSEPCPRCGEELRRQEIGVAQQREGLAALFTAKKGRGAGPLRRLQEPDDHFLLPNDFFTRWRRYLRQPSPELRPATIDTAACLCPHGLLGRPVHELVVTLKAPLTPLSCEEWKFLSSFYSLSGPPLRVSWFGPTEGWRSQPELCGTCFADLASQRERYRDATIHIRKVDAPLPGSTLPLQEEEEEETDDARPSKISRLSVELPATASENLARRSGRQRRLASDRAVKVSSDWTLRQLKVELMNMFAAAPFDQHLMLPDGTDLSLADCTLQTLGIKPGDLLLLWTEEATVNCYNDCSIEDGGKSAAEETGFRGTKLMAS